MSGYQQVLELFYRVSVDYLHEWVRCPRVVLPVECTEAISDAVELDLVAAEVGPIAIVENCLKLFLLLGEAHIVV